MITVIVVSLLIFGKMIIFIVVSLLIFAKMIIVIIVSRLIFGKMIIVWKGQNAAELGFNSSCQQVTAVLPFPWIDTAIIIIIIVKIIFMIIMIIMNIRIIILIITTFIIISTQLYYDYHQRSILGQICYKNGKEFL